MAAEITLEEFVVLAKKRVDDFKEAKTKEIVEHQDDWYAGDTPDTHTADESAWWEGFDSF